MKYTILLSVALVLVGCAAAPDMSKTEDYCHKQIVRTLADIEGKEGQPRNILVGEHSWNMRPNVPEEWCNGFWSGVLWYDYLMGHKDMEAPARRYTAPLESLAHTPVFDHDLGFLVITSLLNGYRATGDPIYRAELIMCADSLATLFNPAVGTILSWPRHVKDYGGHNTIMDNMINLELLFWAAHETGNEALADIAVSHADTTMAYQFRPDATCYHVAVYDPATGRHLYNCTHQGLADESVWARGQAWAIYGYTMVYRYTRQPRFREMAQKAADVYLSRLPEDMIPNWDFCDPRIATTPEDAFGASTTICPRDASAGALVASALLELRNYVDMSKRNSYQQAAEQMVHSLSTRYAAGEQCPALLLHSTGHHPAGSEIDASIIYADYYFMEALYRLKTNKIIL